MSAHDKTRVFGPGTSAPEETPTVQLGQEVDGFILEKELGKGGAATVYLGLEKGTGRKAAVKVMLPEWSNSTEMLIRAFREMQAIRTLQHDGIVRLYSSGFLGTTVPFFCMEYCEGMSLQEALDKHGRFAPHEVVTILRLVCSALSAAHQRGIIHRDLKAGNIILNTGGDTWRIKLLDFGIAKFTAEEMEKLTRAGLRIGTPACMSPEQLSGAPVDLRTDIYALGVLTYQLLVGQWPFTALDVMEYERKHLYDPPPRASAHAPVPVMFDDVILRAMEKKPEKRFPSVDAFLSALERAHTSPPTATVPLQPAIGLFLDVQIHQDDDATLAFAARLLDDAETLIRQQDWQIHAVTSTSFLAFAFLSDEPEEKSNQLDETLDLSRKIRRMTDNPATSRGLHVNVSLHQALQPVHDTGDDVPGTMGELDWTPNEAVRGVFLTAAYRDALKKR